MKLTVLKNVIIVAVVALAAGGAWAATEYANGYTWTYRINGDTAEIYNYGSVAISPHPSGAVTVPSILGTKPVRRIGNDAFCACSDITRISLPSDLKSIGTSAFSGCSGLTHITIPNGITYVEAGVFRGCTGLQSIIIPSSVISIGESAFDGCSGLETVVLPDNVVTIGPYAFRSCRQITEVVLPEGMTTIGESAFRDCIRLKGIDVPDSIRSIGEYAFCDCVSLTNAVIGYGVKSISPYVFGGCYEMKNVTIPEGVTNIGYRAFYNCRSLTSIVMPSTISRISLAFEGCCEIVSVTIPSSVARLSSTFPDSYNKINNVVLCEGTKEVPANMFADCYSLASVNIPQGVLTIGRNAFYNCFDLTDVSIPDSVTSIGESAFYNCSTLNDVVIPSGVRTIGVHAFSDCSMLKSFSVDSANLQYKSVNGLLLSKDGKKCVSGPGGVSSVVIPDGVTIIGQYAFYNCNRLTSVLMPDSLKSIESLAFFGCSKLSTATIPRRVESIGELAFSGCEQLVSISLPQGLTTIPRSLFSNCSSLASVDIPDTIIIINDRAFNNCVSLNDISIPSGVMSIGRFAFASCCKLKQVTIPDSVTSIGEWAFSNSTSLVSVTIPQSGVDSFRSKFEGFGNLLVYISEGVTNIGNHAFSGCSGLKGVVIPNSVISIGDEAFSGCSGLAGVYITDIAAWCGISFDGRTANPLYYAHDLYYNGLKLTALTIPDSVENIRHYAFSGCSSLKNVVIPFGITNIGNSAFSDCIGLTGVTIPNSVITIGDAAFNGCSGLTSVLISDGVAYIGNGAFGACSGLTKIIIPDSVVTIGQAVLGGCSALEELVLPFVGSQRGNTHGAYTTAPDALFGYIFGYRYNYVSETARQFDTDKYFNIPESLKRVIITSETVLASGAFYACTMLEHVSIPSCLVNIGDSAFLYCTALIEVSPDNPIYKSDSGLLFTRDGTVILAWRGLKYATIPSGVKHIGERSFLACNLEDVTIPSGVVSIGVEAFHSCGNLRNVFIPGTVTIIGERAFLDCDRLTDIYIPQTCNVKKGALPSTVTVHRYKVNQTVWFNVADGTITPSSMGVEFASFYGVLPVPTRVGYLFNGWFLDGREITSETVVSALDDHTLVAQWTPIWRVTFDANGGTVETTETDVICGLEYGELPTATRERYRFDGWMLDGSIIVSNTVVSTASDHTLVAQWTPIWRVTFDANGGTVATSLQDVVSGEAYGTLPTPTRAGFEFLGWQTADGMFVMSSTVPTEDHTLTARWGVCAYGYVWKVEGEDDGVVITGTTTPLTGSIMLPSLLAGLHVKAIEDGAFADAMDVTAISTMVYFGSLRDLFPNSYAKLMSVAITEGTMVIPDKFIDGCDNVVNLTLPESLREFGIDDLPSKIRASLAYDTNGFMIYGNWILDYRDRNAAEVVIPEGIVGIGRGAFAEMYYLTAVKMPESLQCVARGAFEGCVIIQNFDFMSGLRYVGPVVFRDCNALLGATFADGVEYIGTNAFEGCWQMQSVRIPYTVTYIGDNAFTGCGNIRGVTVPTQVKTMREIFPDAYSKIETAEVAEGETAVMGGMFAGCSALRGGAMQTDMSMIPSTVTNIGARAFQTCTSLTAFVLPDSIVEIGESAFSGCTALWNVTLSRNLITIPDYAFYGCSMLETMIIPESVTYLGDRFFSGRTNPEPGHVIENALYYLGNAPDYHSDAYAAIAGNMTTYFIQGSLGWDGRPGSPGRPKNDLWNGYHCTYWTPNRFDVTFDANGGRFDSSGGSTWSEQQITDTGYALPSTEPVRPGWAFEGWWTEVKGGAEVRYTTLVTATRAHTLYAHWRWLGEGMTVTFNSNGGTVVVPGSQDYVPGQTFGQFPVPTRRGYTFQGWWTEAVNGIRMTEATAVPAADMELFAHWAPITYYVRFHANGGTGTMADQVFTYDVRGALATHTFVREGFAFSGWATTPSGQVRYAENASVVNLEEVQDHVVDLYAVWSGVGYSVRFDSNGGTGIMDNQTIAVGETQNLWPCAFARAGYAFAGWALSPTDAEARKVAYRDGAAVRNLATANGAVVPLYAVWVSSDQTVRITFDANGGSASPDYWDCVVGTAVEAFPTPTRPGFDFAGWWTAKTGGTQVTSIARVTSAQMFYAHWTGNGDVVPGDHTYTVTFNPNGGSVSPTSRDIAGGSAVGALPTPTRKGFEFVGWFTAAVAGTQVTALTVVTADVTFYAHWTAIEAVEQTITIPRAGWNLVSFNVMPDDPSPEAVFAAVADSVQSVVSGTRRWTPQSGGRLAALQIGVGYWVKTTRDNVVWTISGKSDESVEIRVNEGWNLIGYPLLGAGAPEAVLKGASEAGIVSSVVSGTRRWTPQSGGRLTEMTPGVGYWLKAAKSGTVKFDK